MLRRGDGRQGVTEMLPLSAPVHPVLEAVHERLPGSLDDVLANPDGTTILVNLFARAPRPCCQRTLQSWAVLSEGTLQDW
jgi:hypothetical protein